MFNSIKSICLIILLTLTITYSNDIYQMGKWSHTATVIERDGEIQEIIIYRSLKDTTDPFNQQPQKDKQVFLPTNTEFHF